MTTDTRTYKNRNTGLHMAAVAVIALFIHAMAGPGAHAQSVQRVIATVNDEPITVYDLKQRIGFAVATSSSRRGKKLSQLVMKQLINEKLQMQAAKSEGISISDAQVQEALDGIARRNKISFKKLEAFLRSRGVKSKTLKDKIRTELAWGDVIRKKFRSLISIGSSDINLELSKVKKGKDGKNSADTQVNFELTKLLVRFTQGRTDKEVRDRMDDAARLRAAFKTCTRWKAEARRYRKVSHKHIQSINADELKDPLKSILLKTEPGQVTPPSIVRGGIEIVAVCNRKEVSLKDKKRKNVESRLKSQQFNQFSQRYLRDLRRDAVLEFPKYEGKSALNFKPSQF